MQNSLTAKKERDSWFDNIKGFLMICVVVGHFVGVYITRYPTFNFLYNFIYTFHMPAFAVVSGYFMKRRVEQKDFASVINKTVVPYMFAQVLVFLIGYIIPTARKSLELNIFDVKGEFSFFFPLYQLWYFAAVIFAFIYCVAIKADKKPIRALVVSVALSVASGAFTYVHLFKLSKSMAFLPFFVIGFICTSGAMDFVKKKRLLAIPAVLVFAVTAVLMWLIRHDESPIPIFSLISRLNNFAYDLPFKYAVLVWLGFILGGTILSFALFSLCPRKKTPLAILGKRGSYVFILHAIFVALLKDFYIEKVLVYDLNDPIEKVILLLVAVAVCYVLVSKPVVKIFKPVIEPSFDIRKIREYLKID